MAFKITRGLVLRTTKSLKVAGQSIAAGTRVKAMAPGEEKGTIKVKVKDTRYPKIAGEPLITRLENVVEVQRGRPAAPEVKGKAAAPKGKAVKTKASAKGKTAAAPAADVAPLPAAEPQA